MKTNGQRRKGMDKIVFLAAGGCINNDWCASSEDPTPWTSSTSPVGLDFLNDGYSQSGKPFFILLSQTGFTLTGYSFNFSPYWFDSSQANFYVYSGKDYFDLDNLIGSFSSGQIGGSTQTQAIFESPYSITLVVEVTAYGSPPQGLNAYGVFGNELGLMSLGPAVPEPTTLLLLGPGLAGLWRFRKRISLEGEHL